MQGDSENSSTEMEQLQQRLELQSKQRERFQLDCGLTWLCCTSCQDWIAALLEKMNPITLGQGNRQLGRSPNDAGRKAYRNATSEQAASCC
jgi:hypothetical protein